MRRAGCVLVAALLVAACGADVVSGQGTRAPGNGSPSNGTAPNGTASVGAAPSGSSVSGTVDFKVTGHASRVTAVLKIDGRSKDLGPLRLPYSLHLAKTAKHYHLVITFSGGEIDCEASQEDGNSGSGSSSGATGSGTLDCTPDG